MDFKSLSKNFRVYYGAVCEVGARVCERLCSVAGRSEMLEKTFDKHLTCVAIYQMFFFFTVFVEG